MFNKRFFSGKNIIFLGLVVALLLVLPKIVGILMLFFASYVLACALNPYVTKLMKKMNRTAASTLVILGSILGIFALFVAFKEIKTFMMTLPEKINDVTNFVMNMSIFGHRLPDIVNFDKLFDSSAPFAQGVVNHSLTLTAGLFQVVVILIAMTMIVYYILIDKDYLKNKFLEFFPPDLKDKASGILTTISSKVGGYVRAQIISMAAVGIMIAMVLVILRVEYATLLGLISGILDIIPILGPTIAIAVILLVAYPMGLVKLILIIAGFLLVQQVSNYVVRPVLFGKFMALHPLMIFLVATASSVSTAISWADS